MYISIINIISPRRRFYDLHGSGENNSCTSFTIHMATAILPSSTIFGTDFSVPTEGPMQAWQYPHQIAGSGGQAGIPRGDTISCTLGRQRSGPSIDVRFPRSISRPTTTARRRGRFEIAPSLGARLRSGYALPASRTQRHFLIQIDAPSNPDCRAATRRSTPVRQLRCTSIKGQPLVYHRYHRPLHRRDNGVYLHASLLLMDASVRQEGQDRSGQVDKTLR